MICLIPLFIVPTNAESDVVIYEVEPFPIDEEYGWVKLFNPSDNPINLSGWEISTTKGKLNTYPLSGSIKACDFKKIILESIFVYDEYGSLILYDNNRKIVHLTPDTEFGWVNPDVSLGCYKPVPVKQEPVYEEPVGMGFYSNEAYEFSFEAPTNWDYQENVGSVQVMIYPQEFNPLLYIDSPKIIVVFENIPESEVPRLSGQELEKYHADRIRSELFTGGKIISTDAKDRSWGWVVSTEFIYLEDLGFGSSLQLHTKQKAFHFKDREFYTVAYFSIDDYYKTHLPIFENVIETLEIRGIDVSKPKPPLISIPTGTSSDGGGCLIATATYGSELALQVQMLREIRDNSLLQTQSGQSFMQGFNQFYYSFSPTIADYERQNPLFKATVKLTITPLITSLSLLNYVDLDSEESVLGYGIGIILMNVGMYFVAPAIIIYKIRTFVHR